MKHYLSVLCLALISFFLMDKAAANLLLKQNPTLLEPDSFAVSADSYQLAKVTWLPDYLGNNKSHGSNRVDDGGKTAGNRNCETFGLHSSCPEKSTGSGVKHPVSGLTCYEKCICDTSYYKYSSSNCLAPKVLGGEHCTNVINKVIGDFKIESEKVTGSILNPSPVGNKVVSGIETPSNFMETSSSASSSLGSAVKATQAGYFTQCTCPAEYNLNKCPDNANCEQCNSKHKFVDCKEGYTNQNGNCVKNEDCGAYPLTVCPTGGTCSKCPDNNTKLRLDSCDTTKGWKKCDNSCCPVDCPAGYTAGVTSCTSGSTKPDISLNGWSGGKQCGVCKCNNVDANCTAANYPVTSIPANATQKTECSTGCGSEKVTRYTFACNAGYVQSGNTCVKDCSDHTLDKCPDNANCTQCDNKYKMGDCKEGYYKTENMKVVLPPEFGGSSSSSGTISEYSCHICSGILIDKANSCPAEYSGMSVMIGVDKRCCTVCSADYSLDVCPENEECWKCGGKYELKSCKDGYYRYLAPKFSLNETENVEDYTCKKCDGVIVKNGASCPTGYNRKEYSAGDEHCCLEPLQTGGTGTDTDTNTCPDESKFKDTKGNWKQIYYQVIGGSSLGSYQWNTMGVPLKTGETCDKFKNRIQNECGISANINCGGCVCGLGKAWEYCNGYFNSASGGCGSSSGGGEVGLLPNTTGAELARP